MNTESYAEANGLVCLELNRALEQERFEVFWTATTREAVADRCGARGHPAGKTVQPARAHSDHTHAAGPADANPSASDRQRTHLEPFVPVRKDLKRTSSALESQTRNCKEANV